MLTSHGQGLKKKKWWKWIIQFCNISILCKVYVTRKIRCEQAHAVCYSLLLTLFLLSQWQLKHVRELYSTCLNVTDIKISIDLLTTELTSFRNSSLLLQHFCIHSAASCVWFTYFMYMGKYTICNGKERKCRNKQFTPSGNWTGASRFKIQHSTEWAKEISLVLVVVLINPNHYICL